MSPKAALDYENKRRETHPWEFDKSASVDHEIKKEEISKADSKTFPNRGNGTMDDLDNLFNQQRLKQWEAEEKETQVTRPSIIAMTILFGVLGLGVNGLIGAIMGAILGFGITTLILGLKNK